MQSPNEGWWECPALIPQVWLNWIHYDNKDKTRAERVHREPFRVDFVMKDNRLHQNLIIIEIDGASHYSNGIDKPSMEVYTEHLRKDRWLRNQGWAIYRVSNNVKHNDKVNESEIEFMLYLTGTFIRFLFVTESLDDRSESSGVL